MTWVSLFSLQVELKVNLNELWNELHNYAQMYRNVQKCTPNGLSTLESASLVILKLEFKIKQTLNSQIKQQQQQQQQQCDSFVLTANLCL